MLTTVTAFAEDGKTAPLFTSHDLVEVTITAPFKQIMRDRSLEEETQGTFVYQDPEVGEVTLDIGIRTRGHFRRRSEVCPFAPLRLNFRKTKGTLFARSDKMKLVTHCRSRISRYTQVILREYIAYRVLNLLSDDSFRVRLLKVTYVESTDGGFVDDNYAFLIEHHEQLSKRIGLERNPAERSSIPDLDPAYTNLVSLFQFLLGNTDFSPIQARPGEPCCHNHVLMGTEPGAMLSIPYDFDMTGFVSAPHARPNDRFGLRNVRERLYRGRCVNNANLDASLQRAREQREAIYGLVEATPGMSSSSIKRAKSYLDSFYKLIDSPRQVERHIIGECLAGGKKRLS
jgi:hypothetical protein